MTMTTLKTDASHSLAGTLDEMLGGKLPNLFRLYVNPFVTQACHCLDRYVRTTWTDDRGEVDEPYQTFLANCFDEALGGAIKLARYCSSVAGRPTEGLIIDPQGRLGCFEGFDPADAGQRITFVPGLRVIGSIACLPPAAEIDRFGFIVLIGVASSAFAEVLRRQGLLFIACVTRQRLAALRAGDESPITRRPDIVVFDESFANRQVPFAAFTAREELFDHWNQRGRTNFHSTTYQPNTISSLHFLRCLREADPDFFAAVAPQLQKIETDFEHRRALFRGLYSRSLTRAIRQAGCDTPDIRAAGDFVTVNGRQVFDAVSGVACSIRGHNPAGYLDEIDSLPNWTDPAAQVAVRLRELTGLEHVVPAVSGASAVENALRIALIAQHPRRHVLALRSGFGGKSLLSLAGTYKPFYKEHVGPLYPDVTYIDPFASDAIARIDAALIEHSVAVVQVELIQGVGGVRAIPRAVLDHLAAARQRNGYLLFVDEIQTGMHRTGPFTRSEALGISPDLLVIGKATSDMMFPFALTLYSSAVARKLDCAGPALADGIRDRFGYDHGYRTVLNVLKYARETRLEERIAKSGALMTDLLTTELAGCRAVRDVRCFGLLIGIELDASRPPRRWFRKRLFWFYLSAMLRHSRFPVLVGFCQYEPNILKITPPLNSDPQHLRDACRTIAQVLKTPFWRLAIGVALNLLRPRNLSSANTRRTCNGSALAPSHEPAAC
jgi:acetylornithine/succinyldiaminopimelate/putrescine aminotransferase